jgi:hypothetical protein
MSLPSGFLGSAYDRKLEVGMRPKRRLRPGRRTTTLEKHARVLQLRVEGASFDEIARRCGYAHRAAAQVAYRTALADIVVETGDQARRLDLERLEMMWRALLPRMLAGLPSAIQAGVAVLRRRSGLLALDPVGGGGSGTTITNVVMVADGRLKQIRELDDVELEEVYEAAKREAMKALPEGSDDGREWETRGG